MPEASFIDDLGADSLDIVELVMAMEEEFDIEIPDDDAEKIQTIGDAISYLEARPRGSMSARAAETPTRRRDGPRLRDAARASTSRRRGKAPWPAGQRRAPDRPFRSRASSRCGSPAECAAERQPRRPARQGGAPPRRGDRVSRWPPREEAIADAGLVVTPASGERVGVVIGTGDRRHRDPARGLQDAARRAARAASRPSSSRCRSPT